MLTESERNEAEYNCLMAGTPIVLADGSTMLIEQIVRQRLPVQVLSCTESGRICSRQVVDWHKKRVPGQTWIRIQTAAMHSGHRGLILTPDHHVFTDYGELPADEIAPGMKIRLPETALSNMQTQALLGTLLGDSRLVASPAFRDRFPAAPSLYLDGGHVEESGLSQYKIKFLAPFGVLGKLQPRGTRDFNGKQCEAAPFRSWRTSNLHQLASLAQFLYNEDGSRKLDVRVLSMLGAVGLAWWFMDDGCRQNRIGKPDTVTLALCRYAHREAQAARTWFAQEFGPVSMGADQVLRFSRSATEAFCTRIAPFVIPTMRYRLPQNESWPKFTASANDSTGKAAWTKVTAVEPYVVDGGDPGSRLRAETRFCITVEDTHRFFTSFGLVRNCRDVLSMCRMYPPLVDALDQTNTMQVYEVDEFMAELALQMTRVGLPVDSELRQGIGERLRALRDSAIEILRVYTEGEHAEEFVTWVAQFFAAKARRGEPVAGSVRIGPTRAQATVEEYTRARKEWKAYLKTLSENEVDEGAALEIAEATKTLVDLEDTLKLAKLDLKAARFDTDEFDGLGHTHESAFEQRVRIRRADFELALAKRGVNFGAKVQQAAILRVAGVPLIKTTGKSGLPQIDKEVLKGFERHPAAKALLRYILTDKTISVYIEGEKRAGKSGGKAKPVMVTEDGYIHPLWGVHRITGRWNSSPNVQNWSKRAGGGEENLRAMICAPEGYTFIGADQKQLEARLVGAMSQCKYLIDVFRRGEDVHSAFAAVGFPDVWPKLAATFKEHKKAMPKGEKCHCPTCAERDKVRDLTKRLEYGTIYGGQDKAIWEALVGDFPSLTQQQVRVFIAQATQMMPEMVRWRERTLQEAIKQGEVRSPILGRRQVFPLGRVDPTVAYNYKAQSGGADLWALGAIDFCNRWDQTNQFDVRLIHNGHDSVLVLCKRELAPQVERDVYECWSREWADMPFEMETKIADRWSEA